MSKDVIGGVVALGLPKPDLMQDDPKKGDYVKGKEEFLSQVEAGSGENGLSAYEIAKKNGFGGTETEWLASLKGPSGEKGRDGKTPVKGTDYFTPSEIQGVADQAISSYPDVLNMVVTAIEEDGTAAISLGCDLSNGNTYQITIVMDDKGMPVGMVDGDGNIITIGWEGFQE